MPVNKTLLNILNVVAEPSALSDSALIIVDAQREYVDGSVPLYNIEEALQQLKELLARARMLGIPIYHVVHHAPAGAAIFNPNDIYVEIADAVKPLAGEPIIIKHHPSSFVETELKDRIDKTGRKNLVIGGFMTHMCVNATARSANDLGFNPTVVASACATRDLPALDGRVVAASVVHQSNLASLADLVATVVANPSDLMD